MELAALSCPSTLSQADPAELKATALCRVCQYQMPHLALLCSQLSLVYISVASKSPVSN